MSCLFKFISSLRKYTRFLGLGCEKDGAPHSESFDFSSTPSRNKSSTSFLKLSPCTFGTVHGLEDIGFTFNFNSNSTGSVFQVQSDTLKLLDFLQQLN